MNKFLRIYGVIIAVLLMLASVLMLVAGCTFTFGANAENIEEVIGVTLMLILGIVFIFLGIIVLIYSIFFIISLTRLYKGKSSFIIDIILAVANVVLFVASIVTAIVEKEAGTLVVTAYVALIEAYAIPAIINDKKILKAKKLARQEVQNAEIEPTSESVENTENK